MTNPKKNVPELRFPEFEGEWEKRKIKQLFKVVSGSTPLRSNSNYYDNGNVPWVKTTDLNNAIITQTSEKVTEAAVQNLKLKLLPKNTLLIAMYGGFNQIGRTGLLQIEATTNQAISALLEMEDTNSKFFQEYLNFNVKKWQRVAASSRKDPNITKKDIENFNIPITSFKEQNKIGDFFSKLNRQIELEEQKLALLEEQKKGYMRKIFSQELRFKDDNGNEYPEWENKYLHEISDLNPKSNYLPDKFYYIDLESVNNGQINQLKVVNKINAPSRAQRLAKKHDVFYQTVRPYQKNNFINLSNRNDIVVSTGYAQLRPLVHYYYLYTLLLTNSFVNKVLVKCTGTNYPAINSKDLSLISILSSSVLEEQQKIGEFFNKLDQQIELQGKKIGLLKQRKKGLLQKMFV